MSTVRLLRSLLAFSLVFMLCTAAMGVPAALASGDPSFVLSVADARAKPGDQVKLILKGSNLTDVYAYEFSLTYDSEHLRFNKASTVRAGFTITPVKRDGFVTFAHTKVGKIPGDNGSMEMATLTFDVIKEGETVVAVQEVQLVDSDLEMTVHANIDSLKLNISSTLPELKDIAGHWAEERIRRAVAEGWITGYEDGTFRPQNLVTRAEFAAMLVRSMKLPTVDGAALPFADNASIPAWAKPYITTAFQAKLLNGYDDNTFRAAKSLTRSEMGTIIVRASGVPVVPGAVSTFADAGDIPSWAHAYIAAGADAGLIAGRGNNRFAPNVSMTRAEAVTIILSLLDSKS